ncbi:tol-pal system protein YbgF [Proteus mirabilis]|uniref:Tol-pal system protein YbgF n=1 Tax=Proteus mirabilis TaxID=584 RepID=A0A379FHF2_PROMI|nr:tol-pal system protein YbgF [Proteus mirabilis]
MNDSPNFERISNAHSQLLTQLQQQLVDSQRDIDMLRGQIQENQIPVKPSC